MPKKICMSKKCVYEKNVCKNEKTLEYLTVFINTPRSFKGFLQYCKRLESIY